MTIFRTYILVIIAIMVSISIIAQESNSIDSSFLKEVYNTYNDAQTYDMDVEVAMYNEDNNLSYPKQINQTIKSGNSFYIQTHEITTVHASDFQLVVDNNSKQIRYLKYDLKQKEELKDQNTKLSVPDFTEMEDEIESIQSYESKTVVVFKENPQYKKTVYTFNTGSKLLEQVDYYAEGSEYGQPAHIQIVYTTKNFNESTDSTVFELENYIVSDGNELKPSNTFKTYSLINNTINP